MEAARHDSLADQLIELHALEQARIATEEEARVQAAQEARRHAEAEARRRREEEEEARQRAEEQALAKAQAQREAEERRALQTLEAELRANLEQEAQARVAEQQEQLQRQAEDTVGSAVDKAKVRTRQVAAGAMAIMLAAAGAYGLIVRPAMQRQALELEVERQEAELLRRDNARLMQEIEEMGSDLDQIKLEKMEHQQVPKLQTPPKHRAAPGPKPKPRGVKEPRCANPNDPLCGLPLK
jgi:fused signal recognition particle receptor